MSCHHVILIPGFFAFTDLGELQYFSGVQEVLARAFAERGLDVQITELKTLPTASIRYRAARVLEAIAEAGASDDGPIHLIGHSTGGLDARVAVTPNASLATPVDFDAFHRVRSIVTIATPHYGTPLASVFGSAMGQPMLRLLASVAITGLERGKLPLGTLLKLGGVFARLDNLLGLERNVLDQLYDQLLADFTDERRLALIRFLDDVSHDRALVVQLTPDSLDLFGATTADPDEMAYGSVITRGRRPHMGRIVAHYYDVYAHAFYLLYSIVWMLTSRFDERYVPPFLPEQERALTAAYGAMPKLHDNDGMAPTLSQVWGEIIHGAEADHLDVVGHYGDERRPGVHADWLPSATAFDHVRFEALWNDVAAFVMKSARKASRRA